MRTRKTLVGGLLCMVAGFALVGCDNGPAWLNTNTIQSQIQTSINNIFYTPSTMATVTEDARSKVEQQLQSGLIGTEVGPFNWLIKDVYNVDLSFGTDAPQVTVLDNAVAWETDTQYKCFFYWEANWSGSGAYLNFTLHHNGWMPVWFPPFAIPAQDIDVSINGVSAYASGYALVTLSKDWSSKSVVLTVTNASVSLQAQANFNWYSINLTPDVQDAVNTEVYENLLNHAFSMSF